MSGNETKKYIIMYHPNRDGSGGGYGVHFKRDGQLIAGYPTMERAERAMMRFVARDKRVDAVAKARATSAFVGVIK